jgi:hypothetical protein
MYEWLRSAYGSRPAGWEPCLTPLTPLTFVSSREKTESLRGPEADSSKALKQGHKLHQRRDYRALEVQRETFDICTTGTELIQSVPLKRNPTAITYFFLFL